MKFLNQLEAQLHLAEWQQRLRMADWDMSVSIVSSDELRGGIGDVDFDLAPRDAKIRILDPNDSTDDRYDAEEILVHEMIHVIMARIEDDPELEPVICQLAKSFVKAYRR